MCKPASFVITKGPTVWWSKKSDSHNAIQHEFLLHADGVQGPNVVNVEIAPENGNLSVPLGSWKYCVDQDILPDWYDPVECEQATRLALKKWSAQKLIGWNVQEAFNPINPLTITPATLPESHLNNLKEWDGVRASVGDSVWDSVGDSVWDGVGAYIGGLFQNITTWKGVKSLGADPWRPLLNM